MTSLLGYKQSPEHIEKRAVAHRGLKHTPEAIAKMSAAKRGRKQSPESVAKRAMVLRGRKLSPEHCAKIGEAKRREKNPNWNGGILHNEGYVYLLRPDHPFADRDGYVKKSRLVMEGHLGRFLLPTEVVHHKGKRDDDRIKKLRLFSSNGDHTSHHHRLRRKR